MRPNRSRPFNVFLTEAEVNLEAVRLGLAATTSEVSEQDKVLARWSIIQRDTNLYAGDFADTQDDLANVTRRLKAQLIETAAAIGTELLPPVLRAVHAFKALLERFQALPAGIRRIVVVIALIAAAIGPALFAFGLFASGIGALIGVLGFLISPIGLLLLAVAGLAVLFRGPLGRAIAFVIRVFKPFATLPARRLHRRRGCPEEHGIHPRPAARGDGPGRLRGRCARRSVARVP